MFLLERELELTDLFERPDLLNSLRLSNPKLHEEVMGRAGQLLEKYPKLKAALLSFIESDKPEAGANWVNKYP